MRNDARVEVDVTALRPLPVPVRAEAPRREAARPIPSPFHQRLLAEELSLKRAGGDFGRIAPALCEARVDLNPHQLEAAAFALDSLSSGGCVLADEVGLGKTVEAGMVIAQLIAEGKTRILILVPAPLRAQWRDELWEKFGLTAECLDGTGARMLGRPNPFDVGHPLICSVPFAANRSQELSRIPWDLVVIDEAHRLRNCWKIGNKTGAAIRTSLGGRPKLLLTATPLQNDLFELYGLASLLDHTLLGAEDAFRTLYAPLFSPPPPAGAPDEKETNAARAEAMADLKERLAPVVQRTLRRQVREYVKYTNRRSIVEDFRPSLLEQELYDRVSEYLQREDLAAIEPARRTLLTLVYRKLLGSSTFAVAHTIGKLADSLAGKIAAAQKIFAEQEKHLGQLREDDPDGLEDELKALYEEEAEELLNGSTIGRKKPITLDQMKGELQELRAMAELARSIRSNSKGDALVRALKRSFAVAREHGWPEKAVIFTESRRTQDYLIELLSASGFAGELSILCGDGSGPDERKALVDDFRNRTKIFLSTEAGAEGLNLQFCNLLVNYDLPWNPQRIEQRIGRIHRYGQPRDVLIINMVNRSNAAEARLYELLERKLLLFDGVFGASDEVLGALESGVDFERRVLDIYQSCRSEDAIDAAFQQLRGELDGRIGARMKEARELLLEKFDADVRARLRFSAAEAHKAIARRENEAKELALAVLGDGAELHGELLEVRAIPHGLAAAAGVHLEPGLYSFGSAQEAAKLGAKKLGPSSALVKAAAQAVRARDPGEVSWLELDGGRVPAALAPFAGREGWWFVHRLERNGAEAEERLLHLVLVREGSGFRVLEPELAALFAEVPARATISRPAPGSPQATATQEAALERATQRVKGELDCRHAASFDKARERWDRFTEEALGKARCRVDEARDDWAETRHGVPGAQEADRPRLRRARDAAEREYRRRLDQLRLEEQRRYADKERAISELHKRGGSGELRKELVATAYWFLR